MARTARRKSEKSSENKRLCQMDAVLLASLEAVGDLGFTEGALEQGARAAGVSPARALTLFPDLPEDLITHFANWADRQMLTAYPAKSRKISRVRDKVALGVRLRLEALDPYRAAVRQELRALAHPRLLPLAARLLFGTCDAIWRAAGDESTDFNYYTKRGLLAGVYSSTVLRWLADDSADRDATRAFLDRRISNVMQLGKLAGRLKEGPSGLRAAARNLKDKVRERRRAAA